MKLVIVSVMAMLFGPLTVHSLQCYRCVSQTSMEDCSSKDTKVTCLVSNAVCAKAEVKSESGGVSAQTFVKGCSTEEVCNGELCNQEGVHCNIECCSDDLCNGEDEGEGGSGEALSCYQCLSSTSMEDCIKHQKTEQCNAGWDRCGIAELHSPELTGYRKGCITQELCKTFCASGPHGEAGVNQCKLSCCEGNLCNSSENVNPFMPNY